MRILGLAKVLEAVGQLLREARRTKPRESAPETVRARAADLTRRGRVYVDARGGDSSIVTVSGGGCTPVRVAAALRGGGRQGEQEGEEEDC